MAEHDDLEATLRPDPARIGPLDAPGALDGVIASGRRKRLARRAAAGVTALAAIAAAVAVVPAALPGVAVDDVAGPGDATPAAASGPSASPSASPSEEQPEDAPSSEAVTAVTTLEPSEAPSEGGPTPTPREESTPPERVELTLSVRTDASSYAQGAPVTISVHACNDTDAPHEEWFADPGWRFRVQVITADDRNIAWGEHTREDRSSTEVWQPHECRDFSLSWDQREGPFEQDGGQQAWEGDHRIELSWWGVAPPPDGMDPGLYDPVGQPSVWSGTFTIEPPADPDPPVGI